MASLNPSVLSLTTALEKIGLVEGASSTLSADVAADDATIESSNAAAGASFTAMLGPIGLVAASLAAIPKLMSDIKNNSGTISIAPTGNLQTAIAELNKTGVGSLSGANSATVKKDAEARGRLLHEDARGYRGWRAHDR